MQLNYYAKTVSISIAAGIESAATGVANTANGIGSISMNNNNRARNFGLATIGAELMCKSLYGVVLGISNDTTDTVSGRPINDRIFRADKGIGGAVKLLLSAGVKYLQYVKK